MNLITLTSGKTFKAENGETLINAADKAGLTLPYSCKNGRCNTCKCKIDGLTDLIIDELGLTELEKANGWKLACSRTAIGNITLDIEDLTGLGFGLAKTFPVKIQELDLLSENVLKLTLRLPPSQNFEFIEGQYLNLIGLGGISRSYSLAKYCDNSFLEFHISKITDGQMSEFLFNEAKINDLLRINGPHGTFSLRNIAARDVVFVANGTGIAPIKAMIESMKKIPPKLLPKSIRIYWGVRYEESLYWKPYDIDYDFTYTPVLSRARSSWAGARGYVQDVIDLSMLDISNVQVYACGSDIMIRSLKDRMINEGLNLKNFFSDTFVVSGIIEDRK